MFFSAQQKSAARMEIIKASIKNFSELGKLSTEILIGDGPPGALRSFFLKIKDIYSEKFARFFRNFLLKLWKKEELFILLVQLEENKI